MAMTPPLARLSAACTRYDELFNLYDEASDIARINAAGGARVDVDPATAELIARALEYCEQADGLFDITIGAVSTLWDFEKGVRPADDAIAAALRTWIGAVCMWAQTPTRCGWTTPRRSSTWAASRRATLPTGWWSFCVTKRTQRRP